MPDPITTDPKIVTPPSGTDPKPPVNAGSGDEFDTSKLTDEQIAKLYEDPRLYKHSRFKELSEAKKERDAMKAEQLKKEEAEQLKKGEYEKVIKTKDEKIAELEGQVSSTRLNGAIERAATKAGIIDPEAALAMIDKSLIKADDNGTLTGIDEALKKLAEEKPYLVGKGVTKPIGSKSNPANPNGDTKRFTLSQMQDPAFYRANEKDIMAARKAGTLVNDLQG